MGQKLLWVNKVLGEWFQTSSFPLSENKISLKVNRPENDGPKIPKMKELKPFNDCICPAPHLSCGPFPHGSVRLVNIDGAQQDRTGD